MDTDKLLTHLIRYEGYKNWPYLDTRGLVTIGYGTNIDDPDTFLAQKFRDNGQPAGPKYKMRYYNILKSYAGDPPHTADFYKKVTPLRIQIHELEDMAQRDIAGAHADLERMFPAFNTYPTPVQYALFDMMYNMGAVRFSRQKWPHFCAAIDAQNWPDAATRSRRRGVSDARNQQIHAWLIDAGRPDAYNGGYDDPI